MYFSKDWPFNISLTLRRWARRTWRAPCPQGKLRRGVASLSPEEARAGSCCRTGAALEMGGDTAPLSCPPKPCPPATTGARCWGGKNEGLRERKRERQEIYSVKCQDEVFFVTAKLVTIVCNKHGMIPHRGYGRKKGNPCELTACVSS